MKQKLLTLFARTPVHVGAGNSVGAIDSPIVRERHTRIPLVPGSALKGVLSDLWIGNSDEHNKLFGQGSNKQNRGNDGQNGGNDGQLLIGEARTLAFPLRSAKGAFAWITCPLVLRRFQRDSGRKLPIPKLTGTMDCIAGDEVRFDQKQAVLEEYVLNHKPNQSQQLKAVTEKFQDLSDDEVWKELAGRLVIVSDEMFSYFVENACEVVTRIKIKDETGVVEDGALFNQEQLPSETLLYAVIAAQERYDEALKKIAPKLAEYNNLLQVGGDETIGLGFCSTKLL